jgi:hypothetical protein
VIRNQAGRALPYSREYLEASEDPETKAKQVLQELSAACRGSDPEEQYRKATFLANVARSAFQRLSVERQMEQATAYLKARSGSKTLSEGDLHEVMVIAQDGMAYEHALRIAKDLVVRKDAGEYLASAHNVIGLDALRRRDLESTRKSLQQSAAADLAGANVKSIPHLRLAEEFLKAGQPDDVVAYLGELSKGDRPPRWKAMLGKWIEEAKAGRLQSFRPMPILL